MTADPYAELEAALVQLRAKHPGLTMQDAALLLPVHLVQPLWERAVDRYLDAELAKVESAKPVVTVATTLNGDLP